MNKIKKVFLMLKYGFQIKTNLVLAILFMPIGFYFFLSGDAAESLLAFYLSLCPLFLLQVTTSFLYTGIVKSSPLSRTMETSFSDLFSTLCSLLGYTLFIICVGFKYGFSFMGAHAPALIAGSLYILIMNIYFCIAYKYFVLSIIGTIFCCIMIMAVNNIFNSLFEKRDLFLNPILVCIIGYVVVLIGLALTAEMRRFFYKHPLSRLAAGAELRKAL